MRLDGEEGGRLWGLLGRALEKLSTDLYAQRAHFLQELIQNCDDNAYPEESGVDAPPSLLVRVDSE